MRTLTTVLVISFSLLGATSTNAVDLKDLLETVKDKAAESVKQDVKAHAPALAEPLEAVPVQDKPQANKGNPDEALWPNMAVDAGVVKQQQMQYEKECRDTYNNRPNVDCACMANAFADERLRQLSQRIREADRRQRIPDGGKRKGEQESSRALFRWLTDPKTQINFPTNVGMPERLPAGFSLPTTARHLNPTITMYVSERCRNHN